ncbi:MAG TPA: hypothetical protein VEB22_01925 [Phycisphaerales bacterium]|nr:hypothetical protein [Phycisphaerales bacterium]
MSDDQPVQTSDAVQTSTINRSWMVKMAIFTVVLFAFGLWGLYDALVAYPNRGNEYADYAKYKYLEAARSAGRIAATAEAPEPVARKEALEGKLRTDLENLEYEWLTALSRVGKLTPEGTQITSPNATLDELTKKWTTTQHPPPLDAFDLPLQWSFAVIGFGLGVMVGANIIKSTSRRYTWDERTNTLTLPGGRQVTPDQLADVDKRKWHKFFCSLVFNDGSPSVELDVLKYTGLEGWVLTMERVRFPERAAEAEAEAAAAEAAAAAETAEQVPAEETPEDERGR